MLDADAVVLVTAAVELAFEVRSVSVLERRTPRGSRTILGAGVLVYLWRCTRCGVMGEWVTGWSSNPDGSVARCGACS